MPLTDPVGRQTEGKGACPLFPLNFNRTHWRGEGKLLSLNCEFNPLSPLRRRQKKQTVARNEPLQRRETPRRDGSGLHTL
jgi:hypothetical protein